MGRTGRGGGGGGVGEPIWRAARGPGPKQTPHSHGPALKGSPRLSELCSHTTRFPEPSLPRMELRCAPQPSAPLRRGLATSLLFTPRGRGGSLLTRAGHLGPAECPLYPAPQLPSQPPNRCCWGGVANHTCDREVPIQWLLCLLPGQAPGEAGA